MQTDNATIRAFLSRDLRDLLIRAGPILFTIYLLLAGMADKVLKPMLPGHGVDAPMPVVLLGALAGTVSAGISGLFLAAVLLAVGYQILMKWVEQGEADQAAVPETPAQPPANCRLLNSPPDDRGF